MKNIHSQSDEALVKLYIDGKDKAFDIILQRYQNRVFQFITRSVPNQEEAEDLFQDVFMRIVAYLRGGKYKETGNFGSWVFRITQNVVSDSFRRRLNVISNDATEIDLYAMASLNHSKSREEEIIDQQLINDVRYLIDKLPESQREVLLMRIVDEMSFKDIAKHVNCSINTALGRMHYAMINLKRMASKIA